MSDVLETSVEPATSSHADMLPAMTGREEVEVVEIKAFFEARNRSFRISEEEGTWEVTFPISGYSGESPYAVGETPFEAARNALALWHDRPDLGGQPRSSA
jgi:hypothetical protein